MGQCASSENDTWVAQQENNPNNAESSSHRRRGHFWLRKKKHRLSHQQSDPMIYDVEQRKQNKGQSHLLYKKAKNPALVEKDNLVPTNTVAPTRLLQRTNLEDGSQHIYAVRCNKEQESPVVATPEQRPEQNEVELVVEPSVPSTPPPQAAQVEPPSTPSATTTAAATPSKATCETEDKKPDIYSPQAMAQVPPAPIADLVCVSAQHNVYVCDTGLSSQECDEIVFETEQACRGHYAAYTYAKQTLGCREFPNLAQICFNPVHTVACTIQSKLNAEHLVLDDREPHLVKYDISKKERQKLDMHTDKSEWTFLIALSDGCGLDYDGGGTYFESLEATVHLQRGHALIFPGKLRHCGRKITKGLRFLLVGFLVDKTSNTTTTQQSTTTTTTTTTVTVSSPSKQPPQANEK